MPPLLILATHNPGKLRELQAALAGRAIEVTSAGELQLGDVPETGVTYAENAVLKAAETLKLAEALPALAGRRLMTLADDSGIHFPRLTLSQLPAESQALAAQAGERWTAIPGVLTARVAKSVGGDAAVAEVYDRALGPDPAVTWTAVLALCESGKAPRTVERRLDGNWAMPGRGGGFGFDPWFVPTADNARGETLGEMAPERKAQFSPRNAALESMLGTILSVTAEAQPAAARPASVSVKPVR